MAGTANLETFADVYEIFSMPYLFDSEEVYKSVMEDTDYMEKYIRVHRRGRLPGGNLVQCGNEKFLRQDPDPHAG